MNRNIPRNNSIATVIKNNVNKKSGKVSDSRKEIQRRFFGLDWKDQKKIQAAFLNSGVSDRAWAYSRLLDLWEASFEQKIQELWDAYHEEKCAWVIIRHFPKEYLQKHIDQFQEGRDYYFVCRRLAADADFVIDRERLSKTDYLMALSHGDRHLSDAEATEILYGIIQDIAFHWWPSHELSRDYFPSRHEVMAVSDFANVAIALYYLEKKGNEDVVQVFRSWESDVQRKVTVSEAYQALNSQPLSDNDYKEELARLVQRQLYYALPVHYKTMTDEEYKKHMEAKGESDWPHEIDKTGNLMPPTYAESDEINDNVPF